MGERLVPPECVTTLERALDEHGIPGASLAVAAGDRRETVVRGVANRRAGWPVTPDTVFQLGSVAKIHTALLVLRLAERGDVDLDAPAAGYVPEWRGDLRDPGTAAITVRQLLCHTAGLQSQHFEHYGRGDGALARLVAVLRADELVHPPGLLFSYSNTGYAVAGRIVEAVTGASWHEAVRRCIAEPLGLAGTVTLPEEVLLHPAATGSRGDGRGRLVETGRWYGSDALTPSGGVSCPPGDLVTLALDATAPGGSRALGLVEAVAGDMLSAQVEVLTPGTGAWGLGWTLFETEDGSRLVGHNGDTPGQAAALRVLPDRRVAVALLVNRQVGAAATEPVVHHVLEAVAGVRAVPRDTAPAPGPRDGGPALPGALLGTYGQDRFEVEVAAGGRAGGELTLSVHRWGPAVLDWFGEPERHERQAATVAGPGEVLAGGRRWWFLDAEGHRVRGGDLAAYVTNGHLAFPRR